METIVFFLNGEDKEKSDRALEYEKMPLLATQTAGMTTEKRSWLAQFVPMYRERRGMSKCVHFESRLVSSYLA